MFKNKSTSHFKALRFPSEVWPQERAACSMQPVSTGRPRLGKQDERQFENQWSNSLAKHRGDQSTQAAIWLFINQRKACGTVARFTGQAGDPIHSLPAFHRAVLWSLLELNAFANLCDSNKQSSSLKSCCDVRKRYIPWS